MTAWDGLKPTNVVQAARADIARRKRNEAKDEGGRYVSPEYEQYAFSRRHVIRADGVFGLIELALKDLRSIPNFVPKEKVLRDREGNPVLTEEGEMVTRMTEHPLSRELRRTTKKHLKNLYNEKLLAAALELEKTK